MYGSSTVKQLSYDNKSIPKNIIKCFVEIHRGIKHHCYLSNEAVVNIHKMIEKNLSEKHQDFIVANILKRKIKTGNANIIVKIFY